MITPEKHQAEAIEWLSRTRRGVVVSPAGSGKTIIAAAALRLVTGMRTRARAVRVGWLANTQEQCQQAVKALREFNFTNEAHIACAGMGEYDWGGCDVLVVDECHHAPAAGWRRQIETCKGALWGFTATPPREADERHEAFVEIFGEGRFVIDRSAVSGRLAEAVVVMLKGTDADLKPKIDAMIAKNLAIRQKRWHGDPGQLWGQVAWQACIDLGIVNNQARNEEAIAVARTHAEDSVLMLVNTVEHGKALAAAIPGARLCHSQMGKGPRRAALQAFKDGTLRCIVATSLADEGLDLPRANVLILVSGGRNEARTTQRTGRVLRAFEGKTHGLIYDFSDTCHPLMAKHSRKRAEIYRELGYQMAGGNDLLR